MYNIHIYICMCNDNIYICTYIQIIRTCICCFLISEPYVITVAITFIIRKIRQIHRITQKYKRQFPKLTKVNYIIHIYLHRYLIKGKLKITPVAFGLQH